MVNKRFKIGLVICILIAGGLALLGPPISDADAGRWAERQVFDSLTSSMLGDTFVVLSDWDVQHGGQIRYLISALGIANGGSAPTFGFKTVLDADTIVHRFVVNGAGQSTNATIATGTYAGSVLMGGGINAGGGPDGVNASPILLYINENDWTDGYLSAWIWWRQDD